MQAIAIALLLAACWAIVVACAMWPPLIVVLVAAGLILGVITRVRFAYFARRDFPRARAYDNAERTWRRFE